MTAAGDPIDSVLCKLAGTGNGMSLFGSISQGRLAPQP
jgi:hypothetical protein